MFAISFGPHYVYVPRGDLVLVVAIFAAALVRIAGVLFPGQAALLATSLKVPFELAFLTASIFGGIASPIPITRLKARRELERGERR